MQTLSVAGDARRRQPQALPEKESARNALPTLPIHGSMPACPEKDEAESIGPMGRLSRTDGEGTHYEVTACLPALTMLAARDSTVSSGAAAVSCFGLPAGAGRLPRT